MFSLFFVKTSKNFSVVHRGIKKEETLARNGLTKKKYRLRFRLTLSSSKNIFKFVAKCLQDDMQAVLATLF